MSNTQVPGRDLGNVIRNNRARRAIYGTYVISCIVTTSIQVGLASVHISQPDALSATIAVLAYLAIPVGGLALVNTARPASRTAAPRRAPRRRKSLSAKPATTDPAHSISVTGR
ncbi:hypothetical protein [Microbacterium sp. CJ88]|uniref:hypothetical protein n=1 Tax=Microbacterium sp. CJ88 TaxID=3445672 RepID=UPI003F6608BC